MEDLQKYRALGTALSMPITMMRDLFGDSYLEWKDETAKDIYVDLLKIIDKVWAQERQLEENN